MAMLFPYVATTRGIIVRVAASYLAEQSDPSAERWFWSYNVRIENGSDRAIQLLSRAWRIVDGRGSLHEVQGEGGGGGKPPIARGGGCEEGPGGAGAGSARGRGSRRAGASIMSPDARSTRRRDR